jgi:hypothetical protein
MIIQKPPTAQNYAIGCFGTATGAGPFTGPQGYIEGTSTAGLNPPSLYKAQLAERLSLPTGVDRSESAIPKDTYLNQNFPNPFNPTTNIEFRIANVGFVSLKVFDDLGREVATLVNETKSPGTYIAKWDASRFNSGVYFCRLQSGALMETKKLMLVK